MNKFQLTVLSDACQLALTASMALMAFGMANTAVAADVPAAAAAASAVAARGAETPENEDKAGPAVLKEVVVTAQKRRQSINTVPMSITAVTGDQLAEQGIASVGDLQKIVTGFRFVEGATATPVYYIRGVGFNESSIGSAPNVSVYVDEVPLAFPVMTLGAGLDAERVEVLKGPQGTLFGQNSTGGAINYIAAKPTKTLKSAIDLSYGSFDTKSLGGYVSGPINDTLKARLAFKAEKSGPWQQSVTSSNELGSKDKTQLRLLLDWQPFDRLTVSTNFNVYRDKSDATANQYIGYAFLNEAYLPPAISSLTRTYPIKQGDTRSADWGPNTPKRDIDLTQQALRVNYDLDGDTKLIYLISHAKFKMSNFEDPDGVNFNTGEGLNKGDINSLTQELRLTGGSAASKLRWIVGGNVDRSTVDQKNYSTFDFASNVYNSGVQLFSATNNFSNQKFRTRSVFGNVDYDVSKEVTGHVAARYTRSSVDFFGCTADGGDGRLGGLFGVGPGACITFGPNNQPGLVNKNLDENNVAWRAGLDWKAAPATLLYGNVSKGYKGGSFPLLAGALNSNQLNPVTQESLVAYELGFKSTLAENTLQLNGAFFHYNYINKQVRGRVYTGPAFGYLEALVNVPKSTIDGAELQVIWRPAAGLTATMGGTYLKSRIKDDTPQFDDYGQFISRRGEPFPNTPKLMGNADLQYDWSLDNGYSLMVGGNLAYQASTHSGFGQVAQERIGSYSTLDLRTSLESPDGKWRLGFGILNAGDKYYRRNISRVTDTVVSVPGAPRTYTATLRYHFF